MISLDEIFKTFLFECAKGEQRLEGFTKAKTATPFIAGGQGIMFDGFGHI